VGFYVDMGASYRWMDFADAILGPVTAVRTNTTVEGVDYLRLATGLSIRAGHKFWLDPHFYVSSGYFTGFHGSTCPGGCTFASQGHDVGIHTLSGFAVSGRWDL
jgi:hypothetical protein